MKQGWEKIPFEKSIVKVKNTTKIPSNNYLEQGLYPIVSQEEGLISGYWNNEEDVFKISTPVVIFGDHTRILKYVDFDFVLGADGVKILQPIENLNAKFFKLFLQSCKIPSLGYSRHYKLLKDLQVPVPPLPEQEKIVSELDCLSGIIEKKRQQLKELDALAQSFFYEMFGNPVDNERGWEVKKLGEVCDFSQGIQIDVSLQSTENREGLNRFLRIVDYTTCNTDIRYVDVSNKKYFVELDDVVVVRYGASAGFVGMDKEGVLANNLFKLNHNRDILNHKYLYYLLSTDYYKSFIKDIAFGAAMPALSFSSFKLFKTPLPPLPLQQSFAQKIEAIEQQKALIKQSIAEVETLFNARMQEYFE